MERNAAAILATEFPEEFLEVCNALRTFRFTEEDVIKGGGNESNISKKFSNILRPIGWKEEQLNAKMLVDDKVICHDTHKVDYIKGRVAFDLEWNSKDQTFDRDLYAFRNFFEYDKISVGILVPRSNDLDPYFDSLGYIEDRRIKNKYGASTTHMKKLLPRLVVLGLILNYLLVVQERVGRLGEIKPVNIFQTGQLTKMLLKNY